MADAPHIMPAKLQSQSLENAARGESWESLGITGKEVFDFASLSDDLKPRQEIEARLTDPDSGASRQIKLMVRIDTPAEIEYYRNGGILPTVLRKLASA